MLHSPKERWHHAQVPSGNHGLRWVMRSTGLLLVRINSAIPGQRLATRKLCAKSRMSEEALCVQGSPLLTSETPGLEDPGLSWQPEGPVLNSVACDQSLPWSWDPSKKLVSSSRRCHLQQGDPNLLGHRLVPGSWCSACWGVSQPPPPGHPSLPLFPSPMVSAGQAGDGTHLPTGVVPDASLVPGRVVAGLASPPGLTWVLASASIPL